jgi:antibiotic biosynthesis monooxygenase (ABM) superfamily enzyme
MIGLVFSAGFSSLLMPKKPKSIPIWKYAVIILQWAFFPIAMVFFGSIPATDAQTRLMLGKYLGFRVTQKKRA